MNWNDLRVFLCIAEAGSLAGAARGLKVNHSTVFRRLNTLENEIRVRLFDRVNGGYLLTPAGERMLELVRSTDESIQQIERELAGQDISPSGKVCVTTAPNIARVMLPATVKALRKSHPQILLEISVGDSDYDLGRREADIALRATDRPPENLIGRHLMELEWWVSGNSSVSKLICNSKEDLKNKQFIGADSSLLRLPAFQWLEANFSDQIVTRANDLSTMAELAKNGIGLALLPSDQNGLGLKRIFKTPGISGQLWLLAHPDIRNVQRVKVVWDALIENISTDLLT